MSTKEWIEIRTVTPEQFQNRIEKLIMDAHPRTFTPFVMRPHNPDYDDEGWSWCDLLIDDFFNAREQYASWKDIADAVWAKFQESLQARRRPVYA